MKNLFKVMGFVLLSFVFIQKNALAQKEINASSKIEKITVFTNNAQIERRATLNLPEGSTTVVFSGLSQYLDVNSLRISGKGSFVIMSQQLSIKYPEPDKATQDELPASVLKNIENLTDSLELLAFDINENNAKKEVLISEKNFLNTSSAISKADTITELKDALTYYRTRMYDINQEYIKVNKTERLLLKKKAEMEARLVVLRNYSKGVKPEKKKALPVAVVSVEIMADKAVTAAQIDLSYIASGVSWTPFYELRIEDVAKPVQLVMKANVSQNTGEDWEKVKFVFSTGKPAAYKVLPVLPVWHINYYNAQTVQATYGGAPRAMVADEELTLDKKSVPAMNAANYTHLTQSLISAEYVVAVPYSIASDGKTNTITLMNEELGATYKFYSIPKVDKDVFLTGYLTGWEKLSLVPGEANIVYQNGIISKTYINTNITTDTLIVSLGVDKRVNVNRKKITDKSKEKIIGSQKERTLHYEITVKNLNQSEISFMLKDQVPISVIEDIKVNVDEISGGKYNELTGEIEWNIKLKPNETRKIELRYTVKHDKNKNVICE